jgi:hypothetical protein
MYTHAKYCRQRRIPFDLGDARAKRVGTLPYLVALSLLLLQYHAKFQLTHSMPFPFPYISTYCIHSCLKLYCQCFSSSTTCGPKCKCVACHNSTLHADSIETARHTILERNPAAFDDKFQKPGTVKDIHGHHGHHAVYGGADIFATTPSAAAASWNSSSSSSRDPHSSTLHSSMRHQHQQQHQQMQHHMPYTFAQQQQQLTPPPPPRSPRSLHSSLQTSTSSTAAAARASATTAPKAYSYTPPAYASAHAGPLPFCLPHTPSPPPPPPLPPPPPSTNSRVNKFGCKCKRSFCLKKYCECFQNATHCGLNCKCTNCKNFPDPDLPSGGASSAATATATACGTSVPVSTSKTERVDPRNSAMPTMAAAVPFTTTTPVVTHTQQDEYQECQDKDGDRMAMMAAVAMAELSGGLTSFKVEHVQTECSLTPAPRRISNERESEWNQDPHGGNKRKVEQEGEGETLSSVPLKKRKPPNEHVASLADDEVRAVVSSSMSVESRNPSPVSTVRSPYYPQAADRFPYHHSMPPQAGRYPPQHGHGHGHASHRASPVHPRASPPPAFEYSRSVSTRYLQPSPPPNFRNSPPPYNRSSPPPYVRSSSPPYVRTSPPPPLGMYSNGVTPSPYKQTGSYEEVLRSSGLPKALSFRKICSKCGKTRGEHGELGFGNKCVYQECGKCGAGQHMHERAGQPMGVLCCLTTEDGATPLASAIYERKIRELAARADLQRELQRRKEEATQDIVQRCQEAEAASAAAATKEAVGADVQ